MKNKVVRILAVVVGVAVLSCVAAMAEDSASLYDSKCASCHGKDAKGNPSMSKMFKLDEPALNLKDKGTLDKTVEQLVAIITKGAGKMPSYDGKITAPEIMALVDYLRAMGGVKVAAPASETKAPDQPAAPAAPAASSSAAANPSVGAGLYPTKCASCHGKDGKGNASMAKMFKVDNAALDLTDQSTLVKSDADLNNLIKKGVGKMPAYEGKLTDDEINSLTAYFRTLSQTK